MASTKPKIAPAIADLAVDIESLTPHPRNARRGDVGAIAESLRRFGQVRPIVVQKSTRHVVAGNHVREAALTLGWERIAAVVATMSDAEALAYLLADNRTSDRASYDDDVLASILKDVAAKGDLEGTGFDGEDVDDLLRSLGELGGPLPERGDAETSTLNEVWGVIIECASEEEQVELLTRFNAERLRVRALMG